MADDLAKAIVRASSMMEQKEKTPPISVLFAGDEKFWLFSPSRPARNWPAGNWISALLAYNKASEEGLIPLDMAHPAAQMMSRAFDIDENCTLIGVFMNPAS